MEKRKKITISVIAVLALLILVSTAVVLYFVIREANYPRHTVSFETGEILNKNEFQDKRYKEGSVLQEWDGVPLVADKMFLDWYTDADLEEKVVFPLTITEDITVYAKYLDGNLPESFYQYDAESDSYFVVKGTEDLPETTIVPDVHNGANGVKRVTKIEGGTLNDSTIDKTTLPLGNSTTVKNLYIGNCVSSIGRYAAAYNTALEYAYIGRNAETYGDYIFRGCSVLTDATLPRKMTKVPDGLFRETGVTSLDFLEENITSIGRYTFVSCQFVELTIPEHITSIGYGSFYKCTTLQTFNAPCLELVGEGAFNKCTSLKTVELPKVKTIERIAFSRCSQLQTINLSNVKSIGEQAFLNCAQLQTIEIPNIEIIDDYVFWQCTGLQTIELPNAKSTKYASFAQCSQLQTFNAPNLEIVGEATFNKCTSLKTIELPKVKTIEKIAFYQCTQLNSVSIPNAVEIGENAFVYCNLSSLNLPRVEKIGSLAFSNSGNFTTINYPNIKYIGYAAFHSCKSLTPTLPEGLIWIGDYAFNHCENATVESIMIPKSLVQIGGQEYVGDNEENNILSSHIFYNCATSTLKEIKVAEGNTHFDAVDGVLYTKNHKYLISYPPAKTDTTYEALEGCEDFGELSFSRNHYLETLILPNSFKIHTDLPSYYEVVEKEPECKYTNLAVAIYGFVKISAYKLKEDNPNYKEIDGIIYSKDGKELMAVPMAKAKGETLTFDENLEVIDKLVFYYNQGSTTYNDVSVGGIPSKIVIGSNVKTISDDVLAYLNNECHKVVSGTFGWTLESKSPNFEVDETGKLVRKEA